jgi:soluble cytochrome b562
MSASPEMNYFDITLSHELREYKDNLEWMREDIPNIQRKIRQGKEGRINASGEKFDVKGLKEELKKMKTYVKNEVATLDAVKKELKKVGSEAKETRAVHGGARGHGRRTRRQKKMKGNSK